MGSKGSSGAKVNSKGRSVAREGHGKGEKWEGEDEDVSETQDDFATLSRESKS